MRRSWKFCFFDFLTIKSIVNSMSVVMLWNLFVQSAITAQIIPDKTLGVESSLINSNSDVNIQGIPSKLIKGGATKGANLFHSFEIFNVDEGRGAYFENPIGVQRILSRVTGNEASKIFGMLGVLGNADLFLINPNGIIFGPKTSLDIRGSFLASTANSMKFADGTEFVANASNASSSPLTLSIPVGLQFRGMAKDIEQQQGSFINYQGKTLALVGGNVIIKGGFILVPEGRLEIGSVSDSSYVGLNPILEGWALSYENTQNFNNIDISQGSVIFVNNGDIQLQSQNLTIKDGSQILGNQGAIKVVASDSIEITGFDLDADGNPIFSGLANQAISDRDAGDIKIDTRRLSIQNGGRISTSSTGLFSIDSEGNFTFTIAKGKGGDLIVNASESIQLSDFFGVPTGLFAETASFGAGGNIKINTQNLTVQDRASISAESLAMNGQGAPFTTGAAGNIDITASNINVSNGSKISVSAKQGQAGNLAINTNSLSLDQGFITAEIGSNEIADGANILLQVKNLLLLENESLISATAYNNANGGNIKVNTAILLALPPIGSNGSDIKATAISGIGGNISIIAQGIFGLEQHKAIPGNQTNDIDASSQFGPSGQVQINTTTDPNQGLVELPTTVIDPSTLVAQNPCKQASSSEFTRSGRGGLPPSLSQDLNGESTQIGLVEPANLSAAKPEPQTASAQVSSVPRSSSQIAPAKGWVYNDKGEVVLVAYNSAVTGPKRLQTTQVGCPVF
jgi:filamentous hemagglutinin family protein